MNQWAGPHAKLTLLPFLFLSFGPLFGPVGTFSILRKSERAVDDFAKNDVFPVEEIATGGRDEELHQSC